MRCADPTNTMAMASCFTRSLKVGSNFMDATDRLAAPLDATNSIDAVVNQQAVEEASVVNVDLVANAVAMLLPSFFLLYCS